MKLPTIFIARPVKMAILLMFMGFLRQSSVTAQTVRAFDMTRHITTADVSVSPKGLHVKLKWSKTIQKASDAKSIIMPRTNDPELCPVRAHSAWMAVKPDTTPASPYLTFQDGNPLTTRAIARSWGEAVKAAGYDPKLISLHSLRRGGASFTYNDCRADLNDVMHQGTWRSMAVRDYIRPKDTTLNTVHDALKRV